MGELRISAYFGDESMKIYFVRHGKDPDGYRGGWSQLDLVPEGIQQAERLAHRLGVHRKRYNIAEIVSSDLRRAMTTAEIIAAALKLPVQPEPCLREMNNGELAGMPEVQARAQYPGLYFNTLQMDEHYPNGESPAEFYQRISAWLADFIRTRQDLAGNALVVTHGGVISIVYHLAEGLAWSNRNPPYKAANCALYVLDVDTMAFQAENLSEY